MVASDQTVFLLPHHQQLIEASGVSAEFAHARGYRSATTKAELRRFGFSSAQCRVPALLVPVWSVHGEIATYQARPDEPRIVKGKPLKYETPKGSAMVIDVPPTVRDRLADPAVPLLITEGVRKADSAVSHGLMCLALLGVWNWRGTNPQGGKTVLPDFEQIAWNGRDVRLCFDSDFATNPHVRAALARLIALLRSRGAQVQVIVLPEGEDGTKTGLDDYLAAGHTATDVLALTQADIPAEDGPATRRSGPYGIVDGCLAVARSTFEGEEWMPLTNFAAEIVEEIIADDGVEERGIVVISGTLRTGQALSALRVPLTRFDGLGWVSPGWGTIAIVGAGSGTKDKVREAIQRLSTSAMRRREYAHAGWRRIDDAWVFLSHGRAIGADGTLPGIAVQLDHAGQSLVLPDPVTGVARADAVRRSLGLLEVAPDIVTVPLLGAPIRAVLNVIAYADFALFIVGPSGVMKSELTALVQRCFGAGFDRLNLPANWAATANFLERVASDFKDCVLVIDDFAPSGTQVDVQRYHASADRVFRGTGNASGRGRLHSDSSARPTYRPRALVVSTGEDIPRGFSIRARLLVIELSRGDVRPERLSTFQHGEDGVSLSQMMASFVHWLAPRIDRLQETFPAAVRAYRGRLLQDGAHARSPEALANLAAAWDLWLGFAQETGAVTADQRAALWKRVWTALRELGASQGAHLLTEDPVQRFLDLLRACLSSGAAYIAGPDGDEPAQAEAWGWRLHTVGSGEHTRHEWRPSGRAVGWLDDDGLFLEPQAVYTTVQQLGQGSGMHLAISAQTLWKRLEEAGLLVATERGARGTRYVRRTFASARRKVLHLATDVLGPPEDDPGAADPDPEPVTDDPQGPGESRVPLENAVTQRPLTGSGQFTWTDDAPLATETDTGLDSKTPWNQGGGRRGRSGQSLQRRDMAGATTCVRCQKRRTISPSVLCTVCEEAERDTAA
jgi:hypothetical protein